MPDNQIYIPFINPVKFYKTTRENLPKYYTKHFDDFMFRERLYYWQQQEGRKQIWQVEDIMVLFFFSNFDPIIATVIDSKGIPVIPAAPALIGLPNADMLGYYAFTLAISLADITVSGCYRIKLELGSAGPSQEILISDAMYVSTTPIENSFLIEYWNDTYHADVLFEMGIQFQYRTFGNIGFLEPGRVDERYRDQRFNPRLLSSQASRQWPLYFGDHNGVTDDDIDLLNRIWSCNNVKVDNKFMTAADGAKFEFVPVDRYPKRGVRLMVEEGLNRNSSIFALETDTTKKLFTSISVEMSVFGDLANQGSMNTVPVINVVTI